MFCNSPFHHFNGGTGAEVLRDGRGAAEGASHGAEAPDGDDDTGAAEAPDGGGYDEDEAAEAAGAVCGNQAPSGAARGGGLCLPRPMFRDTSTSCCSRGPMFPATSRIRNRG